MTRHAVARAILVFALLAGGCGGDEREREKPARVAPSPAATPADLSVSAPLGTLEDALASVRDFAGAQACASPPCGARDRQEAITSLSTAGNQFFSIANSDAEGGCVNAGQEAAEAVVKLRAAVVPEPDAKVLDRALEAVLATVESYGTACR